MTIDYKSGYADHLHKFGYKAAVGATYTTIWSYDGLYNWIMASPTLLASSSSVEDKPGGDGCYTMSVDGLDTFGIFQRKEVTLDGIVPVAVPGTWSRIFRGKCLTGGATELDASNDGDLYVYTGTEDAGVPEVPKQVYLQIEASEGQTQMAVFTMPANRHGVLCFLDFGDDTNRAIEYKIRARPLNGMWQTLYRKPSAFEMAPSNTRRGYIAPLTDVNLVAKFTGGGTAAASGEFGIDFAPLDVNLFNSVWATLVP